MLYAELNADGVVIGERAYDPPLSDDEIPVGASGMRRFVPLKLRQPAWDAQRQRMGEPYYVLHEGFAERLWSVIDLAPDEIERLAQQKRHEMIEESLPHWTETDGAMVRAVLAIHEWIEMQRDPKNPATWFALSDADLAILKRAAAINKQ